MSDSIPTVLSVVIPTYNREPLVPRAVRSVLDGANVDVEVLVVDDGSEDDTEAAVAAIGDARVRYTRVPHAGVSAARNAGASAASGRWLAFLDSDDEVLPGWADTMVRAVKRSGEIAICGGEALDSEGRTLWTWTPPAPTRPLTQQVAEMFLPGMFVVDRRAFLDAGGYVETLAFGENTELALRLLFVRRSRLAVEPIVLVRRNIHTPRDAYSASRPASARYVLAEHPWTRHELPALWASYHAIAGGDKARRREWRSARRHFVAAAIARPSLEHLRRLAAAATPLARLKVWPAPGTTTAARLRVLLLSPEYAPEETGGIATYMGDLARGLGSLGQQVDVLVVRRDQRSGDWDDGPVRVHRRPQVNLIPGSSRGGLLSRVENASFVQRLAHALSCRRHVRDLGAEFDVIEGCEWMAGSLLLPWRHRIPVVLHAHGAAAQVERRGRPSLAAKISELLEELALRRSSLITVPSPAMAEVVSGRLKHRHRVRLVPCPTEVRKEVPPAPGTPSVLYVGRLDWLKAPEVLVLAGALLRERIPNVEIRFIGRSYGQIKGLTYGQWLAQLAQQENSPCRFLGPLAHKEVIGEIAASSVLAVTSRFEAFGLTAAEALGQGRPVVCTRDCGIAYLIAEPAGTVVPFGDAPALANALAAYLTGGPLEAAGPHAALSVAQRHLDRAVVAEEKLTCYGEAMWS